MASAAVQVNRHTIEGSDGFSRRFGLATLLEASTMQYVMDVSNLRRRVRKGSLKPERQ